jgi:predicted RNA binding protein YcfA (HicA-like mRNA interferase family)
MKWVQLAQVLQAVPLSYSVVRQSGSHRKLESANGYPPLNLAFHDKQTIPPGLVRSILTKGCGLDTETARSLL